MAEPTVDVVRPGQVTYHTCATVSRIASAIWLTLDCGQKGCDWEQHAFGVLSPAKARELAAKLLVEAARIEGDLDGAEVQTSLVTTTELRGDTVGTPPSVTCRLL